MRYHDPRGVPSAQEEIELIRRAQDGETEAAQELVLRHYAFVVHMAKQFSVRGDADDADECDQVAAMALNEAIYTYDLAHGAGARLTTYACWWMRSALRDHACNRSIVRLPRFVIENRHLRPVEPGSPGEAQRRQMIEAADRVARGMARIGVGPRGKDGRAFRLDVPDRQAVSPLEAAETSDEVDRLKREIDRLPATAREIVVRRHGLDGRPRETLRNIGPRLGMSGERVRQIELDSLATLAKRLGSPVVFPGRDRRQPA